jgi:HEAT repeat protein
MFFVVSAGFAGELKDDWNDFLHYTKIGRYDLATSYGQAILDSESDPVALLGLTLENPKGFDIMLLLHESKPNEALAAVTTKVLAVIEQGRFVRRSDPQIVVVEVKRLSSDSERGRMTALKRLQEAGEFSVPFMLDVLADPDRRQEHANVIEALPKIGQPAIRPLAAALQTTQTSVKVEAIRALGKIGYPQSLAYLKYVLETDDSSEIKTLATQSIQRIDPTAYSTTAAELFFKLGEMYYGHAESLKMVSAAGQSQIWFWDTESRRVVWASVNSGYVHELMAMRSAEWCLTSEPAFEQAIGLWLAGFFKAEALNVPMPDYLGQGHATAFVYATTAGPKYLHHALARGLAEGNADVALGAAEALVVTSGRKAIFVPVGDVQPLLKALISESPAVRYSAAIAIAQASPTGRFQESDLVIGNLADAIEKAANNADLPGSDAVETRYDYRAIEALETLGASQNRSFDLGLAQDALIKASQDSDVALKGIAIHALAYLNSPMAQAAIATAAMNETNAVPVRNAAFLALADSGRLFGGNLDAEMVKALYELIRSDATDESLRKTAAIAFGALDLPSQQVKALILDQAKS